MFRFYSLNNKHIAKVFASQQRLYYTVDATKYATVPRYVCLSCCLGIPNIYRYVCTLNQNVKIVHNLSKSLKVLIVLIVKPIQTSGKPQLSKRVSAYSWFTRSFDIFGESSCLCSSVRRQEYIFIKVQIQAIILQYTYISIWTCTPSMHFENLIICAIEPFDV